MKSVNAIRSRLIDLHFLYVLLAVVVLGATIAFLGRSLYESTVSQRGATSSPPQDVQVTIDPRYDSREFPDLVAVLQPYQTRNPFQTLDANASIDLVRPGDGAKLARIEVSGSQLVVLRRPAAGQLLITQDQWNEAEKSNQMSLLRLDARAGFSRIASINLPDRYGYTVYVASQAVLSTSERFFYYVMHSRKQIPECTLNGTAGPDVCDVMSVGIVDLDQLSSTGSSIVNKLALPQGCGAPVLTPTGVDDVIASCRKSRNVFLLNGSGGLIRSDIMGVEEVQNQFSKPEPANAFGFQRSDGTLAVMSWRGTVTYHDSGGGLAEKRVLPDGVSLARLAASQRLENGDILVGVSATPFTGEVTGVVAFDPETLAITQRVDFGAAESFAVRSKAGAEVEAIAIREDGSLDAVSRSAGVRTLLGAGALGLPENLVLVP